MDESSDNSNLDLLVFYLTNSNNLELISKGSISLLNEDNKVFRVRNIMQRPNNPLLTLIDDTGSEKLYAAQNLKTPYWSEAIIDLDVLDSIKNFYVSTLLEQETKSNLLKIKQVNEFQRNVEIALQKHKNILGKSSIEYKGYSRTDRAYVSHCYKCKQTVNSKSNYVCNVCNHLICNKCGNCKCLFVDLDN